MSSYYNEFQHSQLVKFFSKRLSGATLAPLLNVTKPNLQDLCLRTLIEDKKYKCTPRTVLPSYLRPGNFQDSLYLQLPEIAAGFFACIIEFQLPKVYRLYKPENLFKSRSFKVPMKRYKTIECEGGNLGYDTLLVTEEINLNYSQEDEFRLGVYGSVVPTARELRAILQDALVFDCDLLPTYLIEPCQESDLVITCEVRVRTHYRMMLDEDSHMEVIYFDTEQAHKEDIGQAHARCSLLTFDYYDMDNIYKVIGDICSHQEGTLAALRELASECLTEYMQCIPLAGCSKYQTFRSYLAYHPNLSLHSYPCVCLPCRYLQRIVDRRVDYEQKKLLDEYKSETGLNLFFSFNDASEEDSEEDSDASRLVSEINFVL